MATNDLEQRVQALESIVAALQKTDLDQITRIQQLEQEKAIAQAQAREAAKEATRANRVAKILLLSAAILPFVFDPNLSAGANGLDFNVKSKEVPIWIGGGYMLAVVLVVLDKSQIDSAISAYGVWKKGTN
jgi:hypothetical protein